MLDHLQYYIFFIFIFLSFFITKNKESEKKTYLFLVMCALVILVGFRNVLYGRDTMGYVMAFKNTRILDLESSVEPGYTLLVYVLRSITDNYHFYLFITFICTPIALYMLMDKFFSTSYEILASICIYVLLGILAFNMAGIRQTIALSFGIIAFIYAADAKLVRFLVFVAVAMTFHNSAFVLLVLYPFRYLNTKHYGFILVAICFFIGLIAPELVIPFFQSHIPMEDRFSQYGTIYESTQNYTGFTLQLILVIIAFVQRNKIQLDDKTKNIFFNAAYLGLAIQSLTVTLAEFFRLSIYFCIFDIILIPLAISTFQGYNAKLIRTLFIIGCLIYILILSGGGVLPNKEEFALPYGF